MDTVRNERVSHLLQYASLKEQYFAGLRAWSEQLADLLSEAVHLCDLDLARLHTGEFFERRHRLRFSVSSLIDQGGGTSRIWIRIYIAPTSLMHSEAIVRKL